MVQSKMLSIPVCSSIRRGEMGTEASLISWGIVNRLKNHCILSLGTLCLLITQCIPILLGAPTIRVTSKDSENHPIANAEVQLKVGDKVIETRFTNADGVTEFSGIPAGIYNIEIWKHGYHELRQMQMTVSPGASQEIEFILTALIQVKETLDVTATPDKPVEQGSSPPTELQKDQIQNLPNRPLSVEEALPLIPGVVRTPDDRIRISGSNEHSSAFIVNGADVTDPATGQFGLTVPVDIVENLSVLKTPYLAQYGRFTAGVISVETRGGGDKWSFEFNDPFPEVRVRGGSIVGIRGFTPRLTVNGPVIRNRLFLSQGLEYGLRKIATRTLGFPENETKQESVNSFTQVDYVFSPNHQITGTFHPSRRRSQYVNLEYFNPQIVTPNVRANDYTGTFIDRWMIKGKLVESLLAIKQYSGDVWGQGSQDMVLTPTGNQGNYFSQQNRTASRFEWMESIAFQPVERRGRHDVKLGWAIARSASQGEFTGHPVNILDDQGRLRTRLEFVEGQPFNRSDLQTEFFAQDRWGLNPKTALDLGLRVEHQSITSTFRLAPRAGIAWTPFINKGPVFRSGFGLFYDRVPLSIYSFDHYPDQLVTTYNPIGEIVDGPRRFFNTIEQPTSQKFPFIRSGKEAGSFAPYSAAWSVGVEQPFRTFLRVQANYLQNNSNGFVIITPRSSEGKDILSAEGAGRLRYRQLELTSRFSLREKQEFLFSYVRSKSKGDLNDFNQYLGNFPFPLVRPNQLSNLPGDSPHRILAWGILNLPKKFIFAPLMEYRTGFPYAQLDAFQNYVGLPNRDQTRFPDFFSLDVRLTREFRIFFKPKYTVRCSFRVINLTNHFNPLGVHANIADPWHGTFFGYVRRTYIVDLDVLR